MRSGALLLSLVFVLGVGYYFYRSSLESTPGNQTSVVQQADVTGVKADLLSIAQAQRLYLADHNGYGTLEQLKQDNVLSFEGTNRRGYQYTTEIDGASHFKIIARPANTVNAGWPALAIDETLTISQP